MLFFGLTVFRVGFYSWIIFEFFHVHPPRWMAVVFGLMILLQGLFHKHSSLDFYASLLGLGLVGLGCCSLLGMSAIGHLPKAVFALSCYGFYKVLGLPNRRFF